LYSARRKLAISYTDWDQKGNLQESRLRIYCIIANSSSEVSFWELEKKLYQEATLLIQLQKVKRGILYNIAAARILLI
jgi:hypothetical protein